VRCRPREDGGTRAIQSKQERENKKKKVNIEKERKEKRGPIHTWRSL